MYVIYPPVPFVRHSLSDPEETKPIEAVTEIQDNCFAAWKRCSVAECETQPYVLLFRLEGIFSESSVIDRPT